MKNVRVITEADCQRTDAGWVYLGSIATQGDESLEITCPVTVVGDVFVEGGYLSCDYSLTVTKSLYANGRVVVGGSLTVGQVLRVSGDLLVTNAIEATHLVCHGSLSCQSAECSGTVKLRGPVTCWFYLRADRYRFEGAQWKQGMIRMPRLHPHWTVSVDPLSDVIQIGCKLKAIADWDAFFDRRDFYSTDPKHQPNAYHLIWASYRMARTFRLDVLPRLLTLPN